MLAIFPVPKKATTINSTYQIHIESNKNSLNKFFNSIMWAIEKEVILAT